MVLIKTLLYTGVRVAELVAIRLDDVDLDTCRIRITHCKGSSGTVVIGVSSRGSFRPAPPPRSRAVNAETPALPLADISR